MAHNGDFIVLFDCKCYKKVFSAPRTKVFRISVHFHLDMDMHMQNPLRSHSCNERLPDPTLSVSPNKHIRLLQGGGLKNTWADQYLLVKRRLDQNN